jgi:hypothetical protein
MHFRAVLELGGKTATGIEVPASVVESLGAGKRPAVTATLNGYSYRTTLGVMGGRTLLPVSAEHRAAAGVVAGDEVDVSLELDTAPRVLEVPDDLGAALVASPAAQAAFDGLSYSGRRRYVLSVEGAKTDETRRRRIAKAVTDLAAGKG